MSYVPNCVILVGSGLESRQRRGQFRRPDVTFPPPEGCLQRLFLHCVFFKFTAPWLIMLRLVRPAPSPITDRASDHGQNEVEVSTV